MEKRKIEFQVETAKAGILEGYAAVFEQPAQIADFTEVIKKGAFTNSLNSRDILALVDHDLSKLLARTSAGTLTLQEDEHGLKFSIKCPDTSLAKDTYALVAAGNIRGCSIGFTVPESGAEWNGGTRILRNIDLLEISIVSAFPAYENTEVQARSHNQRLTMAWRWLGTVGG